MRGSIGRANPHPSAATRPLPSPEGAAFRKHPAALLALLCALLLALAPAHAAPPPRPNGPIADQANIIPDDQEAALAARLTTFATETGKTLAIATVASLDGDDIAPYANALFRSWGVGDAAKDEGVLLVVAPNDRRVRIEVGRGSEGILPDALTARIIDGQLVPRFKAEDFGGGISVASEAIMAQLQREPTDAAAVAAAAERAAANAPRNRGGSNPAGAIVGLIIFFVFVLPLLGAMSGRKRGRRYSSGVAGDIAQIVLWSALNNIGRGGGGGSSWGGGGGGSDWGGGGGGFGGFGGGDSGGGGASGSW